MVRRKFPIRTEGVDDLGVCPCHGEEYMNTSGRYAVCPRFCGKLVPRFTQRERRHLRRKRWRKTCPLATVSGAKKRRKTWRVKGHKGLFFRMIPLNHDDIQPPEIIGHVVNSESVSLVRLRPIDEVS